MIEALILTKDESLSESLARYLITHEIKCKNLQYGPSWKPKRLKYSFQDEPIKIFEKLVSEIESFFGDNIQLTPTKLILVDFYDPELTRFKDTDVLSPSQKWSVIVSMLILAFPEIQWVFITSYKEINGLFNKVTASSKGSNFIVNGEAGVNPLFDATGIRDIIFKSIRDNHEEEASYLPERKELAVAVDDEKAYSLFCAYTAYRFGFRAHSITSLETMECLYGKKRNSSNGSENGEGNEKNNIGVEDREIALSFEDLYLNFPDKSLDLHLSELSKRDTGKGSDGNINDISFPKFKNIKYRILTTIGHAHSGNNPIWQRNRRYLLGLRIEGNKNRILYKPFAGIFDLWKKSGMKRWLKRYKGLAQDFKWPPSKGKSWDSIESEGGHSAPGRLLAIAEKLIERSRAQLETADTVPKAIHGAMLALEARELLGNRTPTTSLEALSLKHQFEVKAECMFYGVEYNFDVKARIKDIKQEVKSISDWFNRKEQKRSALNAEIGILNKLAAIYRNYGQFDEENAILDEMRKLHSRLWSSRKQVRWALYPVRRYIEILMSSLSKFAVAILFWIVLFGSVFHVLLKPSVADTNFNYFDSLAISTSTFLGFQPPDIDFWGVGDVPEWQEVKLKNKLADVSQFWFVMPAVLGFIHLGIFITHLYMIILRRAGP